MAQSWIGETQVPLADLPLYYVQRSSTFPKRNGIERLAQAAPRTSLRLHWVQTEFFVCDETWVWAWLTRAERFSRMTTKMRDLCFSLRVSGPHKDHRPSWEPRQGNVAGPQSLSPGRLSWVLCPPPSKQACFCPMWLCCGQPGLTRAPMTGQTHRTTGSFWATPAPCLSSCLVTSMKAGPSVTVSSRLEEQLTRLVPELLRSGVGLLEQALPQRPVTTVQEEFMLWTLLGP